MTVRLWPGTTIAPYYQAVGHWYQDFPQMTDGEVRALLTSPSPLADKSPSPSGGGQGGGS
jgi:hypothetical protein